MWDPAHRAIIGYTILVGLGMLALFSTFMWIVESLTTRRKRNPLPMTSPTYWSSVTDRWFKSSIRRKHVNSNRTRTPSTRQARYNR